jgi:nitrite reductase/ring-hydroxylating ferredoxin subunit
MLIAVPMGSWISAVLIDWLGGDDGETSADVLVGAGLVSALPTVATGYNDWAAGEPTNDTVRRVGLVHAALNASAVTLFGASLAARLKGDRGRGKLLALAGVGAVGAGGYLGGHLTYAEGVGVDTTVFEDYPENWTQALADAALGEGEMKAVEVGGAAVLIARRGGRVYALADTCVHREGSLAEGELVGDCVKCPLHGSVFQLSDGSVEQGPAAYPQPVLEARVRDGSIEVRAPQ